jgi:hypothetical protein
MFERWESQARWIPSAAATLTRKKRPEMLTISVQEYDIADVRPVFGKEVG